VREEATIMVSQATYEAISLEDPFHQWEMFDGRLTEKPSMTVYHNRLMARLTAQLVRQFDENEFEVRMNTGRLSSGGFNYFIPDVHVVPVRLIRSDSTNSSPRDVLSEPMPFVAEVWSPSTGDYDVDQKFPEYKARGDLEIWRLHSNERTLNAWRRRDDGGYDESLHSGGSVRLLALSGVIIDLDQLFRLG
jgi:Uma2 family endonuclease